MLPRSAAAKLRALPLLALALAPLVPALRAQVTNPAITEWVTARSYARIYETYNVSGYSSRLNGTTVTTWPASGLTNNNTGGAKVSSPVYSDIQRVAYDNTYVYVYATGLPSYVAGNWLKPNGSGTNVNGVYANWPINRATIHRIKLSSGLAQASSGGSTSSNTGGNGGLLLNGVLVWPCGDGQSYDNTGSPNGTSATIATNGDGLWNRLAGVAEDFNFDPAKGHQPPSGAYHNHVNPVALRHQLGDHVSYNASSKTYAEITATAPSAHSPLLGFANDGVPIYGPYGYATATDASSGVRRMVSGFVKRDGATTDKSVSPNAANTNLSASGGATGRTTLPKWIATLKGRSATLSSTEYGPRTDATYSNGPLSVACSIGLFAEDYDYLGDLGYTQGTDFDLNQYNARWCVTPEYPSGTWAYFVAIDASGATTFPDILGPYYFGSVPSGNGTVTSVTGATDYVKGGQASALSLAVASAPSGVALSWPSVEGATYTAAYSNDGNTFTTLSTSLSGTLGGTATYATSTVAPYYKITLTALASYDTSGNGGVTGLNTSATATYAGAGVNTAPTLTAVSTLSGAAEDTAFTLSYATLAAASDEADADGDTLSFRIESVTTGTLTKNGSSVTAGATLLSSGESLVWTPAANANGTLAAFTVRAYDGSLASSTAVTVNVSVAAADDAPTLTTVSTLAGAVKNTAFTLSYSTLAAAADESDPDGTTPSFRIESVSSGTLTKSGFAVVPGATLLSSGESLVWTPATDATGALAAFTVRAYDGSLASSSAVQVSINVTTTAVATDALLSSWHVARTGRYARIVETDAELLADTTKTTWTRTSGPNTISQSSPVYAGPQQIDYSASWVYVRTPSLATYTMGPWYNNAAKSALFVNVPKNQGYLVRFPRSIGAIPATKTGALGLNIGGVMQPAAGYYVDGVAIFDPTDGFSYANGTESSPGTGQWHRDAYVNEGVTFDKSYAHQQNTGVYHNHANPIALRYQLGDNVTFNAATKTYAEGDTSAPSAHSPIIGWMIDGLPVYGPYGYSSALDAGSGVRRMVGGFVLRDGSTTGVDNISTAGRTVPAWSLRNGGSSVNGPTVSTTYPLGRYIEDYAYLGDLIKTGTTKYAQGVDFDLNEYNVRYCVTPEFPNGTWAYFLNITAAGVPRFPYMMNRWFYGTPVGGSVNSITETVTNQFLGGANRPLAITGTDVATPNVTVAWNAVEGATYAVAASANGTNYTAKASGITVSNANSAAQTYAALGSSGTEYARVTRTAIAAYDSTGTVAATVSQTATAAYSLGVANRAPTLATIANLADGAEDTSYLITYDAVAAASDATDPDGDPVSFRVEETFSGILTKDGATVTAGTLLSPGESFLWTPPSNGNAFYTAMTVTAYDGSLASANPVAVQAYLVPVNDAPVLTDYDTFAGTEDMPLTISYTDFVEGSDARDPDGDSLSFRVESVVSGTLTKNGVAVVPGTTLLSAGESLVWTPAPNANGALPAFTLAAFDGTLASSPGAPLTISITAVNDAPTLTGAGSLEGSEDQPISISYSALAEQSDERDVDGDAVSFLVVSIPTGALTKNGVAVTPGVTTLSSGETLVWTPDANANGTLAAFTVKAYDGTLASDAPVQVNATVSPVNDAPTFTTVATLDHSADTRPVTLTYSELAAAADEADIDGDTLSFRIESVTSGTLAKNGSAVVPGTTTLATGESLVWTPPAASSGTVSAFTIRAYDGALASADAIPVPVSISALVAPEVTESPGSDYAFPDEPYTFIVSVTGSAPLTYQWHKNGEPIPGATSASLTLNPPLFSAQGTYTVTVTNDAGSDTSDPAVLAILDADTPIYSEYRAEYFTPEQLIDPAISGDTADPDADGLPNLLEYAFNLDPRHPEASPITVAVVDGHLQITYPRLADNDELVYTVEATSDLSVWNSGASVTTEAEVTLPDAQGRELVTERDETALTTSTRRFLRLRVDFD